MIYLYSGTLFINKGKQIIARNNNMDKSHRYNIA